MPVPIKLNKDDNKNNNNFVMDYSFLLNSIPKDEPIKKVAASDNDAKLLFEIWSNSEKKNEDTYKVASKDITQKDIIRLKTLGFISGDVDSLSFTAKGKVVVSTMALGENNKFQEKRQEKNYSEILASMDKRNKSGYRVPKYASSNSNIVDISKKE